ncbi:MAG: hypothetical protein HRU38_16645 [Saccharospirillaceae bacterium]|nr:hypothetical protein [Pseudomonadales bacterium]NRB80269.1 hypothetical protein [Saccharospirillaceae bacterium]
MNIELKQRWNNLIQQHPKKRIRDAADSLNVSEMELLTTDLADSVWQLKDNLKDLVKTFKTLGKVFSLVRNQYAVNEKTGTFKKLAGMEHVGLFLGEMDQRLFFKKWAYGFYVNQNNKQSFQFFDEHGQAILKLYKKDETNESAWNNVVNQFKNESITELDFDVPAKIIIKDVVEIDDKQFAKRWSAIKDVHQFAQLMFELSMPRKIAFEKAPVEFAHQISKDNVLSVLEDIQQSGVPVVLFVGNKGAIQIFTGKFEKIVVMDKWLNVFNKDFTLHLDGSGIEQLWLVKRPSAYGVITSLEVMDKEGNTIMQIFGERAPKELELTTWRKLLTKYQLNSAQDTQNLLDNINKNNEFITKKEVEHG